MGIQSERRKRKRIAVHWPLRVSGIENSDAAGMLTEDLSSSGFYFVSPAPFEPGEQLEWLLAVPARALGCTDLMLRGSARVVRVQEVSPAGRFGVGCLIHDYQVVPLAARDLQPAEECLAEPLPAL